MPDELNADRKWSQNLMEVLRAACYTLIPVANSEQHLHVRGNICIKQSRDTEVMESNLKFRFKQFSGDRTKIKIPREIFDSIVASMRPYVTNPDRVESPVFNLDDLPADESTSYLESSHHVFDDSLDVNVSASSYEKHAKSHFKQDTVCKDNLSGDFNTADFEDVEETSHSPRNGSWNGHNLPMESSFVSVHTQHDENDDNDEGSSSDIFRSNSPDLQNHHSPDGEFCFAADSQETFFLPKRPATETSVLNSSSLDEQDTDEDGDIMHASNYIRLSEHSRDGEEIHFSDDFSPSNEHFSDSLSQSIANSSPKERFFNDSKMSISKKLKLSGSGSHLCVNKTFEDKMIHERVGTNKQAFEHNKLTESGTEESFTEPSTSKAPSHKKSVPSLKKKDTYSEEIEMIDGKHCGRCRFCKDMKKFGGPGRLRKACLYRKTEKRRRKIPKLQ